MDEPHIECGIAVIETRRTSANCPMPGFLLLFDLDGTLIDSVPDLTNALNEILGERGYPPLVPEEVAPMVGDGVPALVARAFAARGGSAEEAAELLPRYIAFYEANATRLTRPARVVSNGRCSSGGLPADPRLRARTRRRRPRR